MIRPLLVAAALTVCGACGGAGTGWDNGRVERYYENAYERWTRAGQAYEYFEGRAFLHVTYWSPEFVTALARYESVRSGHLPAEAAAHLEARQASTQRERRFLVTLVTQTPYWNDLNRADASFQVRLLRDGQAIEPTGIRRVKLDEAEDLKPFYPHVQRLGNAYWVTFPASDDPQLPVMRVAGPPARIDLRWNDK